MMEVAIDGAAIEREAAVVALAAVEDRD